MSDFSDFRKQFYDYLDARKNEEINKNVNKQAYYHCPAKTGFSTSLLKGATSDFLRQIDNIYL